MTIVKASNLTIEHYMNLEKEAFEEDEPKNEDLEKDEEKKEGEPLSADEEATSGSDDEKINLEKQEKNEKFEMKKFREEMEKIKEKREELKKEEISKDPMKQILDDLFVKIGLRKKIYEFFKKNIILYELFLLIF